MANFLNLAITGLEHFHPTYGKLIGTGKNNGIQVFEQLIGKNKRILTSVKDGETVKQVVRTSWHNYSDAKNYPCMDFTETVARNFVTGERIKSVRGLKTKGANWTDSAGSVHERNIEDIYRNVEKQEGNGNWEEYSVLFQRMSDADSKADVLGRGSLSYAHYDVQNGKFIEYTQPGNGRFHTIKAASKDPVTGKVGDYVLPNGSLIPKGGAHYADVKTYHLNSGDRLLYRPDCCDADRNMEKNLGNTIFNYFDKLTQKLNGVKPPKEA